MLARIVRMTFSPEQVPAFLELFDRISPTIRQMPGCQHLSLLQDTSEPFILSTYSIWENEAALTQYRNTDFFKATWKETKLLFAAPAQALSHTILRQL